MTSFHGTSANIRRSNHAMLYTSQPIEMNLNPASHYPNQSKSSPFRSAHSPGSSQVNDINPLARDPPETLIVNVRKFVNDYGFGEELRYFEKGALAALDPSRTEDIEGLEPYELDALRKERSDRWHLPRAFWFTIMFNSIAAAIQGWDQTGTNGANLTWPRAFGVSNMEWIIGFVNCMPYLTIFLFSGWISDPLSHRFGRKKVIFGAAICSLIAPLVSGTTQNWGQLTGTRVVLGLGMGLKEAIVPVFTSEISPKNIRGTTVMSWQFFTAAGIFLGTVVNLALFNQGENAWRYQIGSAFIPAVPVLAVLFCPESPRWLMSKGRYPEAYRSLCRLRSTRLQAARELYYIHCQMKDNTIYTHVLNAASGANMFIRFKELFTIPRLRRATQASGIVMFVQQISGINIIAFYSSTIFMLSGWPLENSLGASLGFGAINVLGAIPAFLLIDRDHVGRRKLLLWTLPPMAIWILLAGLTYLISADSQAHLALVATFIFLYAAFYSWGPGPVAFTYSAEAFPQSHREIGMAFSIATNNFWGTVISLTFPRQVVAWGIPGTFGFYAAMNVVAFLMVYLWLPETNNKSLEDLDHVFAARTRQHMHAKVNPFLEEIRRHLQQGSKLDSGGESFSR